jgi:hypothetical protein
LISWQRQIAKESGSVPEASPRSSVAKILKLIKGDDSIMGGKVCTSKRSAPFARFTLLRFLHTHHFDEIKNFCNRTVYSAAVSRDNESGETMMASFSRLRDVDLLSAVPPLSSAAMSCFPLVFPERMRYNTS